MQFLQEAGIGSTLVLVDCYGCREDISNNPESLANLLREIIDEVSLTAREFSIDAWNTRTEGPSTAFYTLAESHVRTSAQRLSAHDFVRAESWDEPRFGWFVGADFQVCNYSKLNTDLPTQMAHMLLMRLGARRYDMMAIQRGPGCYMRVLKGAHSRPELVA